MGHDAGPKDRDEELNRRVCDALEAIDKAASPNEAVDALIDRLTGDTERDGQMLARVRLALSLTAPERTRDR
jgi:hypothetical protein